MDQPIPDMIETIQAMKAQLRQDYIYMEIRQLAPLYLTREGINKAYHFSFPEGTYCVFVLNASSKIPGMYTTYEWMLQAQQFIRDNLDIPGGDFEPLIQGPKLYCLIGSTLSNEDVTEKLHVLFDGLNHMQGAYTCAWTMGIGRFVTSFSNLRETIFSAQHALKYSIKDGIGKIYDGNRDCVIFEGGLTLTTATEQLSLKRLVQKANSEALSQGIRDLFAVKMDQILKYPVFAYMLSLQVLNITIQTLREIMPVDRKTYELSQQCEDGVDDVATLDGLIEHTVASALALCDRYQLFLSNGRSQPIWLAITYIQEHYTENITLEDLSRVADRNPQYISAVFSKTCGMSLKEYITSLRIEEARRLLRSSNMPIGDVAVRTGYQDAKYFSRIFQKTTGQSPREYRASELGK